VTSQEEYEEGPSDVAFRLFLASLNPDVIEFDRNPKLSPWELRVLRALTQPTAGGTGNPHKKEKER